MSFSDYKTISQVQAEFQIKYQEENFLDSKPFELTQHFLDEFHFNQQNLDVFASELARCEIIIFPILREVYKHYYQTTSLWVQKSIRWDDKLNGTPDYMLSKKSALGKTMLEYPLLMVVEAKRNDFEQGWAQCMAELLAVQKLNNSTQVVYGIVTDGKLWEFAKLEMDVFTKNMDSFTSSNLAVLFAHLNHLFFIATQITQ